jgi:hypothetical protein
LREHVLIDHIAAWILSVPILIVLILT